MSDPDESDDEQPPVDHGWHRTQVFGHRAYVNLGPGGTLCPRTPTKILVALRIGNIPLGVPFRASGAWGVIDVETVWE